METKEIIKQRVGRPFAVGIPRYTQMHRVAFKEFSGAAGAVYVVTAGLLFQWVIIILHCRKTITKSINSTMRQPSVFTSKRKRNVSGKKCE